MLESLFNKVAGLQVSRRGTLLKRDSNKVVFCYEYYEILKNTHLRNIWECLLLYQSKLLMFHYYIAACFTALKRQSICNAIFSFIFFLFLFFVKLKPLCDKKTTREKIIRSFFCVFMIDSF